MITDETNTELTVTMNEKELRLLLDSVDVTINELNTLTVIRRSIVNELKAELVALKAKLEGFLYE